MSQNRPLAVFAYDFDGTLAPGNMQEHAFIPDELGMSHADFWAEARELAIGQRGDPILAYMHLMLEKARGRGIELSRDAWVRRGANLPLFPGVEGWFQRQTARAAELGLDLRHFIISSGNRELIEGSPIARHFERIYASAFLFDANDDAIGAALAVNYTSKTQYLFRINKWTLEEWDDESINKVVAKNERAVPFDRIAFFGDGQTDIPCMRLVTDQGGAAVAVYNPAVEKSRAAAKRLLDDGRARHSGVADYSEGSDLDLMADELLREMAARVGAHGLALWPQGPQA
ncbi:HAD family hydrolase [Phenylobacterium sp.]|uniref:HAD family hydrolase n=1 Tax=Phenylobacterium sp. TaxID=1871053 RepID=UPI002C96F255|nr:HAD family hydrolase [Phenylobacterium sp.]HLZ76399.1 HAD family hydrolase [Phenylobacterium sp.]